MSDSLISRINENDRWQVHVNESRKTVEELLDVNPRIDMDLASFIRCITFRLFSVVFLDVDPNALVLQNLQVVTGALTDFYNDAQGTSTLAPDIQNILYAWLPTERFPDSLHRILPAYEALWRIVAMLVVTCEDDETQDLRWVMLDFRDNPRDRQYMASFEDNGRSASAITEEVASRITLIVRPQHATTSTWPLSCIQYASASGTPAGYAPTVQEALKFAALLASRVIGRIGVHYVLSGVGVTNSQASPWAGRRISGVNRSPGPVPINGTDFRVHASSSRVH